ncbi:hypothetical protein L596_004350 [Steinernema carpocapsae]|uniref:Uncharacterized protein n=1 Tax=Steinernema carpocapsae TaxID=34508 RepID=A0A4U8UX28_STECR|nr:hypothetical protein L596_004350 [Steinernema carpocapsae]
MLFGRLAHCARLISQRAAVSGCQGFGAGRPSATAELRLCSTHRADDTSNKKTSEEEKVEREEKTKNRKRYALGGCLITMWFSTHVILLWRRRSEFREMNEKVPPTDWENFVEEYLAAGRVKSIVFQPSFEVADVYLFPTTEDEERTKAQHRFLKTFRAGPEKFTRPPDVRFAFYGSPEQLQKVLSTELRKRKFKAQFNFEVNSFPSSRELAFIIISTLFTLAAVGLKK